MCGSLYFKDREQVEKAALPPRRAYSSMASSEEAKENDGQSFREERELWSHFQGQNQGTFPAPRTGGSDNTYGGAFRIARNMTAQPVTPPPFKSTCSLWLSGPCATILPRGGERDNLPSEFIGLLIKWT